MIAKLTSKRVWFVLIIFIALAGLFFYNRQKAIGAPTKKNGVVQKNYTVIPKSLNSTLTMSGRVDADEKVTLQFQTSGKLVWVGVKEGQIVQKWQALASLDQRDVKKNLDKKLLDFMDKKISQVQFRDENKSSYAGNNNVYFTDTLTRLAQQTQNGVDKSVIDVELYNLSLEVAHIYSPIEGIVTHIDQPVAGVNITPATARFEIVNPNTLYLETTVDQQDVVKLQEGNTAEIVFDPFPDKIFTGKVYFISYTPENDVDNSYNMKVEIPDEIKSRLRLGMGAEITVKTAQKNNVLAVPFVAVTTDGKKSYVEVLKNNKVQKREVKVGIETDEYTEIKKGLRKNEVIVY